MSTLHYWWAQWSRAYHRLALRQIDPLHPDVPHIVATLNHLDATLEHRHDIRTAPRL